MRVCPWCEMEVYDDPDREEKVMVCPHCENELGDYRHVNPLKSEWFGELEIEQQSQQDAYADADEDEQEVATDKGDPGWANYDQVARKLQDMNDDILACATCTENMVPVGEHTVQANDWKALTPDGWKKPLLSAPFRMTMWLCPACFRMEQTLCDEERDPLIRHWSENG
jgi:hypothetical protein